MKKTTLLILLVVLLSSAGIYHMTSAKQGPQGVLEVAVRDLTEHFAIEPSLNLIQPYRKSFDRLHDVPHEFRFRDIIDVDQGPVSTVTMDGHNMLHRPETWNFNSNDWMRGNKVKDYNQEIKVAFQKVDRSQIGYENTSLLAPLVQELLYFQSKPNYLRALYLFSDLEQFQFQANFLDPNVQKQLRNSTSDYWEGITDAKKLSDLSGVSVYIIHQPKADENERFKLFSNFLRIHLEKLGATVTITGSLTEHPM